MSTNKTPIPVKITSIDYRTANHQMIEKNTWEYEENNNRYEEICGEKREEISLRMNNLYALLNKREPALYMDIHAQALSLRQEIQNSIAENMQRLSKYNAKYNIANGERIEYYATGYGMKVTDKQRTELICKDLAERKRSLELIETYIEFLRECKFNCDSIGYAIKNFVSLLTYLSFEK